MKNPNRKLYLFVKYSFSVTIFLFASYARLSAQSYNLTPVGYFPVEKVYSDISVAAMGNIYLLSTESSIVDYYSGTGELKASFGKPGSDKHNLRLPSSLWTQNDLNVYIADTENNRIVMLSKELALLASIEGSSFELNSLSFRKPLFAAVIYNNDFIVLDGEDRSFIRFNQQRQSLERFGGIESGNFQMIMPTKVFYGNNQLAVYDAADSTYKFYSEIGNPLKVLKHSLNPTGTWGSRWVNISNNILYDLWDSGESYVDFNYLIDEPILDFEIVGNRFYLLTAGKVVILNVSK